MTRIRSTALVASGGAMAILAAGCGGSSSGSTSSGQPAAGSGSGAQSGTAKVEIVNYSFKPSTLTVKAGTKVTFTMMDASTVHTATGSGNASFIKSPNLKKGQSYTVTFNEKGTFNYICNIHPYMKGTITVQ
jgi:amicyanin